MIKDNVILNFGERKFTCRKCKKVESVSLSACKKDFATKFRIFILTHKDCKRVKNEHDS